MNIIRSHGRNSNSTMKGLREQSFLLLNFQNTRLDMRFLSLKKTVLTKKRLGDKIIKQKE